MVIFSIGEAGDTPGNPGEPPGTPPRIRFSRILRLDLIKPNQTQSIKMIFGLVYQDDIRVSSMGLMMVRRVLSPLTRRGRRIYILFIYVLIYIYIYIYIN